MTISTVVSPSLPGRPAGCWLAAGALTSQPLSSAIKPLLAPLSQAVFNKNYVPLKERQQKVGKKLTPAISCPDCGLKQKIVDVSDSAMGDPHIMQMEFFATNLSLQCGNQLEEGNVGHFEQETGRVALQQSTSQSLQLRENIMETM